jgi:hypothetical protein
MHEASLITRSLGMKADASTTSTLGLFKQQQY